MSSLQKRGFRSLYRIRITDADLYVNYGSLQDFKDAFAAKTADVNGGIPVPINIAGIDNLPPIQLSVVASEGQVGIQGATWVVSQFFELKKLGSATHDDETFTWAKDTKTYVCNKQAWSKEHVFRLLEDAKAAHMPHINLQIKKV